MVNGLKILVKNNHKNEDIYNLSVKYFKLLVNYLDFIIFYYNFDKQRRILNIHIIGVSF